MKTRTTKKVRADELRAGDEVLHEREIRKVQMVEWSPGSMRRARVWLEGGLIVDVPNGAEMVRVDPLEVTMPFTGTTSSSIGRSDPAHVEAARVENNVVRFDRACETFDASAGARSWNEAVAAKMAEHAASGTVAPISPGAYGRLAALGQAPHLSAGYGTMTLTAKHSALAAKPTRWVDGALAEEQMRVPTSDEVRRALEAHEWLFLPSRGRVMLQALDERRGTIGTVRVTSPMSRDGFEWFGVEELRVPRMPEVGSTWRDSGARTYRVNAALGLDQVEFDEGLGTGNWLIEDWYREMRPVPAAKPIVGWNGVDEAMDMTQAEYEHEVRRLIMGPLALPSLPDIPPLPSPLDIMNGFRRKQADTMRPVLQAVVSQAVKEMAAKRDVKAGEMVTAEDVEPVEPARRLYRFEYNAVFPIADGSWPDSLGEVREQFEAETRPRAGSLADLQAQPGVKDARNDGPGRVLVVLKRGASAADVAGLRAWTSEHMWDGGVMVLENEPPTLEAYVREQLADVPASWATELWRARVLGMLEQTSDRSDAPSERLRLMAEYVTRVRRGAPSEMVGGLSTTSAIPRWWKGETPPRPERMGLKRGRVTR